MCSSHGTVENTKGSCNNNPSSLPTQIQFGSGSIYLVQYVIMSEGECIQVKFKDYSNRFKIPIMYLYNVPVVCSTM